MPIRLSGLDAAFLHLETRTSHMHVGAAIVLDPAAGTPVTKNAMVAYLSERLHLVPAFRRRLAVVPLGLDHPLWIEDPDFDLHYHVRRAALPAPGGLAELGEYVGDVMSRPLDRSRPLWELHVVEGLEDGRVAVITKTHHAVVDGVRGVELASALVQLEPGQQPPPPQETWHAEHPPHDLQLLLEAAFHTVGTPVAVVRTARRVMGLAAGKLLPDSSEGEVAEGSAVAPAPFAAPMTGLNGAIGAHRRVAFAEVALEDVKAVKDALGGTVNDVVLTGVTGALRAFLAGRGEPVDRPLVAMVPISVHGRDGGDTGANQVSAMLVGLPVQLADPVERLADVRSSTTDAKGRHGARGAHTIQQLAQAAPAGLFALAARAYTGAAAANRHRPVWNVIVSNVPGPPIPLFVNDAKVEAVYPIGPVHEMVGLNITLFSYNGTMFVGLNADRDLVGDLDDFALRMTESFGELAKCCALPGRSTQLGTAAQDGP